MIRKWHDHVPLNSRGVARGRSPAPRTLGARAAPNQVWTGGPMEGLFAKLVTELRTLRKGRGLYVGQISDRVGPALREVCGVVDGDGPAEIRRKVADRLESLASGLPEDLRVTLMAAFGIDRDARLPFYQDRVRWAAERIHRDDRTARRRIDEGIDRIAELAASLIGGTGTGPAEVSATGWHTDELKISLALDQPVPEVFELRRVVAERDHLTELDLAMTLTAGPEKCEQVHVEELTIDVFYGGTLIKKTLESKDRFGLVLALPDELRREQRYDFALRYRVPNGHMQPHFVCVPKHRTDLFELRVRFDLDKLPERIWRLSDAFQRDVDDPTPAGETLWSNVAGEVRAIFRQLTPGRAYGIRWSSDSGDGY
ncbi:MAG TPA: hypothetical protein VFV67_09210 [Actinophytocola sp.]|uniref:hypothetical protein n=1 Tax=Actinophytocola sp. TaxID=1872138 RepID=UPI002DBE656E|nr:hypothetical protein [Actinophytocola sp.]HEU5470820.1 hypothetical protein [Actinophytocola sp.]